MLMITNKTAPNFHKVTALAAMALGILFAASASAKAPVSLNATVKAHKVAVSSKKSPKIGWYNGNSKEFIAWYNGNSKEFIA